MCTYNEYYSSARQQILDNISLSWSEHVRQPSVADNLRQRERNKEEIEE
jgi:hypothetical protein